MARHSDSGRGLRGGRGRVAVALLALVTALGGGAGAARGDEYVSRVNSAYTNIPASKRSDTVLLPLIGQMADPPPAAANTDAAALLTPKAAGWDEAAAWATAAPQKAVLAALATVTKPTEVRDAYSFGQPYGVEGIPVELVQKRLYTELGDPPTLAGAQYLYLPGLGKVSCLVNVEATRLLNEGKASDAIDVMINWVYFGRQMADREMFNEVRWGFDAMAQGLERVRDIAYTDLHGEQTMDVSRTQKQVERVQFDGGYLDTERIAFPQGNFLATDQVIARVYRPDGTIDERTFATTMSSLGSTEFPLRLFSESARWRADISKQLPAPMVARTLEGIRNNVRQRWSVQPWDSQIAQKSPYRDAQAKDFAAALFASLSDPDELYWEKLVVRTEIVGTQTSLAVVGWTRLGATRGFPNTLAAIRPQWVKELPTDPFNPERGHGARPSLQFFVPMRDTSKAPFDIEVFVPGRSSINVPLKDDNFVLYSYGSDNADGHARRNQNTAEKVELNADYLIWPPVLSLRRAAAQEPR